MSRGFRGLQIAAGSRATKRAITQPRGPLPARQSKAAGTLSRTSCRKNALTGKEDSPGFPDQSGFQAIQRRPQPGNLPRRAAIKSKKQQRPCVAASGTPFSAQARARCARRTSFRVGMIDFRFQSGKRTRLVPGISASGGLNRYFLTQFERPADKVMYRGQPRFGWLADCESPSWEFSAWDCRAVAIFPDQGCRSR